MKETAKFKKELVCFLPLLPHAGECGAASDIYNIVVMRALLEHVSSLEVAYEKTMCLHCVDHLIMWMSLELVICIEQMYRGCATDQTCLLDTSDERCDLMRV